MEKDVDEVGKIARNVKAKIEALNKEVRAIQMILAHKLGELYSNVLLFRTWPIGKNLVAARVQELTDRGRP